MLKKFIAFSVSCAFAAYGWSYAAAGSDFLAKGKRSAEEATRFTSEQTTPPPVLSSTGSFSMEPDTTGATFYEEERNLVKEIVVWVVGAAFVGYFIIKVFLEGDKEEPQEEKPQKEIPSGAASAVVWSWTF